MGCEAARLGAGLLRRGTTGKIRRMIILVRDAEGRCRPERRYAALVSRYPKKGLAVYRFSLIVHSARRYYLTGRGRFVLLSESINGRSEALTCGSRFGFGLRLAMHTCRGAGFSRFLQPVLGEGESQAVGEPGVCISTDSRFRIAVE